jgi:hypothetical protein
MIIPYIKNLYKEYRIEALKMKWSKTCIRYLISAQQKVANELKGMTNDYVQGGGGGGEGTNSHYMLL